MAIVVKNSRVFIPSLDDMGSSDTNAIIRAVLLAPSFKELFDADEYASLKEKLGMENISGGRRKSHGRTRKHRRKHVKKSRKVRKSNKSRKSTKGRKGGKYRKSKKARKGGKSRR